MPKNRALFGESNSVEQVLVRQGKQDEDIGQLTMDTSSTSTPAFRNARGRGENGRDAKRCV